MLSRRHGEPFGLDVYLLLPEGLPDRRRGPLGTWVSDEPCGFNSRPFRSRANSSSERVVLIDGTRGVTEACEFVKLEGQGSTPAGHPLVLRGESQMASDVLAQPTLVLNRQWQPVHVASVARAVTLLCNDTARVVDPEEYRLLSWDDWLQLVPDEREPCIRSARLRLKVPEVICLASFDRSPQHGGDVQPSQCGETRSLRLPVLRSAAGGRCDHDRSHRAEIAGW